jgi:hypothetical protein
VKAMILFEGCMRRILSGKHGMSTKIEEHQLYPNKCRIALHQMLSQ